MFENGLVIAILAGLALIAQALVDFFVYRWQLRQSLGKLEQQASKIKALEQANNSLAVQLSESLSNRPVQVIEPMNQSDLIVAGTPKPMHLIEGSPEIEALKIKIGEVMAQNIVLHTRASEVDEMQKRIHQLEPFVDAAKTASDNLSYARLAAESLEKKNQELQLEILSLRHAYEEVSRNRDELRGKLAIIESYTQTKVWPHATMPTPMVGNYLTSQNAYVEDATPITKQAQSEIMARLEKSANERTTAAVVHGAPEVSSAIVEPIGKATAKLSPKLAGLPEIETAIENRQSHLLDWTQPDKVENTVTQPKEEPSSDDFSRIPGLLPDYQAALKVAGITTYKALSQTSPLSIRKILKVPHDAPLEAENWIRESTRLAYGV